MADETAWPFLIGRSKNQDYRVVVVPGFMADSPLEGALLTGTGGDPGPPGSALVREIGPPGQRITAVYQVRPARADHDGVPGAGPLSDAHGRPILLTEGLVLREPAASVLASGLSRQALTRAHALVAPAFQRFWSEESGFIRRDGRAFPLPPAALPGELLDLKLVGLPTGTGPAPAGSPPAPPAPAAPGPAPSGPAGSVHRVRSIRAPAWPAASGRAAEPAAVHRRRSRAPVLAGVLLLVALVAAGGVLLLSRLLRGPAAAQASAAQTMTTLCGDLTADRLTAAYALTARAYHAEVSEAQFASTVLPLGDSAATCAYQPRSSGASSATGVMTVTQQRVPVSLTVTLAENSARQWQVTSITRH
jgi:hypothetical protein